METVPVDGPESYRYTRSKPRITCIDADDTRLRVVLVDTMERLFGRAELQRFYDDIKAGGFELSGARC